MNFLLTGYLKILHLPDIGY